MGRPDQKHFFVAGGKPVNHFMVVFLGHSISKFLSFIHSLGEIGLFIIFKPAKQAWNKELSERPTLDVHF
jgi:hypothetical protein